VPAQLLYLLQTVLMQVRILLPAVVRLRRLQIDKTSIEEIL
jgi:hypothetical protein